MNSNVRSSSSGLAKNGVKKPFAPTVVECRNPYISSSSPAGRSAARVERHSKSTVDINPPKVFDASELARLFRQETARRLEAEESRLRHFQTTTFHRAAIADAANRQTVQARQELESRRLRAALDSERRRPPSPEVRLPSGGLGEEARADGPSGVGRFASRSSADLQDAASSDPDEPSGPSADPLRAQKGHRMDRQLALRLFTAVRSAEMANERKHAALRQQKQREEERARAEAAARDRRMAEEAEARRREIDRLRDLQERQQEQARLEAERREKLMRQRQAAQSQRENAARSFHDTRRQELRDHLASKGYGVPIVCRCGQADPLQLHRLAHAQNCPLARAPPEAYELLLRRALVACGVSAELLEHL